MIHETFSHYLLSLLLLLRVTRTALTVLSGGSVEHVTPGMNKAELFGKGFKFYQFK